jgi:hypothetical protein
MVVSEVGMEDEDFAAALGDGEASADSTIPGSGIVSGADLDGALAFGPGPTGPNPTVTTLTTIRILGATPMVLTLVVPSPTVRT